ncbi:hypothetical protein JHK86_050013 [Glycine max]|nr:hypothetical protein JHK86_050013 [Glycine max]
MLTKRTALLCLLLAVPTSASIVAQCRVCFLPRTEMSASSPSQAKEQDDDTKPLWTYVTKIKSVGGGGNYEIKCNICDFTFNGSYTRVRAHLLKMTGKGVRVCQKVTIAKFIDLKKIDNEATLGVERSKTKSVSLPPIISASEQNLFLSLSFVNECVECKFLVLFWLPLYVRTCGFCPDIRIFKWPAYSVSDI